MEAIVLAGGFGKRLSHIVTDVPKPMAPVCGRPFLRYILDDLIDKGITKIILAVGYKQETIIDYFGNNYKGIQTIYSVEDIPLFTGGAIKKALGYCSENEVLVVNGDTYFDVDILEMLEFKRNNKIPLVIATTVMHNFNRYGTLKINENRITSFEEKEYKELGLINGGIYLMNKSLLDDIEEEKFLFETDFLEKKVDAIPMYAYESKGYFIDIGIPEDYTKAQVDFSNMLTGNKNKAAFFDRDGTINVNTHHLYKIEDFEFIDGMPQLIKKYNDEGYKVIVVTNQAGIAKGYYTEDDMRKLHNYINERLGTLGAHIDAFYFCPHHPDITGPCHCRKPEPGMIEQAIRDFDIDVSLSVLYGDKPWDIEAGEKCRIKSYYVDRSRMRAYDSL